MNEVVRCEKHGELPWDGHIMCTGCGASYTTKDVTLSTHAPYRCANTACKKRLLPHPTMKLSEKIKVYAIPCCSKCFELANFGTHDDHGRDDASCTGLECPFHGPQLRKLARRAAKVNHDSDVQRQRDEHASLQVDDWSATAWPGDPTAETMQNERERE
jgi:hypothetical protein